MEAVIKDIIATIEAAVADFQKKIPGIQDNVFNELQNLVSRFETKGNNILGSTANLKLIGNIGNAIERIIVNSDYLEASTKFVQAFSVVEGLQNNLFAGFNAKFTPKKTLKVIKELAVESTTNALLDQGLRANIVDKVSSLLKQNITASVSIAQLNNQLRDHITTNQSGLGSLERYTTQITTDAINQYSAQYNDAVAQDLGIMNWGRYVGSNLTTTREFCEFLTKKQWVHRTELPKVLLGIIDGHECHLNKKTGLPDGMIAGTNNNNFNIYRGGYNCGHQFFWVPDASVPDNIKNNIGNPAVQQQKYDLAVLEKGRFGRLKNNESVKAKVEDVHPELNLDQKVAVWGYTEAEYYSMNASLRGESAATKESYHANYKNLLNEALDKLKSVHVGPAFRGTQLPKSEINKYYEAFNNKRAIEHPFFTSSSAEIGESFGGNTRFSILSKTGKFIRGLSNHPSEQEVLFKAGTMFKVLSIREDNGVTYIKLEEA